MYIKKIKKISLISLIGLFVYIPLVSASFEDFYEELDEYFNENYQETVIINNSVKASSNTGGNVAESGEVINGKSESSVRVRTIINGEIVENFENIEKSDEGNQKVIYDSNIKVIDNKVKIEAKKEINGEVEKINKEIILNEDETKIINKDLSELKEVVEGEAQKEDDYFISEDEFLVGITSEGDELVLGEEKKTLVIFKYLNIILDILKNNIDRISKLF
ncbi:MAG: hypothetical protein PF572_05515 [Patescibacteria group bacterium]|jgi:hypothetical protein|nr:hypothetical protein [Patescibacteria group bacterium]